MAYNGTSAPVRRRTVVKPERKDNLSLNFVPRFKAPEGTRFPAYGEAVMAWTGTIGQKMVRAAAAELMKNPALLTAETMSRKYVYRHAALLFNKLHENSREFDVLYRGTTLKEEELEEFKKIWKAGQDVEISLTSFTRDSETAYRFANDHGNPGRVFIRLLNARGLDISDMSIFKEEKEVITAGRLHIINVEENEGIINITAEWLG